MGLLEDKVILVTGGARGQGAAEAKEVVAEGGRVVIADLLIEEGKALVEEIGESAIFVHLDVTQEDSWQNAINRAVKHFGRLDGLVNNAGYSTTTRVEDVSVEELDKVYAINQKGVALGIKNATPALKTAGGGAIVNIASNAGLRPMKGKTAYGGAKAAVLRITEVTAWELAQYKIRVNSVLPGVTNTAMVANAEPEILQAAVSAIPLGEMCEPEDISHTVIHLLSDKARLITGAAIIIDGGLALV